MRESFILMRQVFRKMWASFFFAESLLIHTAHWLRIAARTRLKTCKAYPWEEGEAGGFVLALQNSQLLRSPPRSSWQGFVDVRNLKFVNHNEFRFYQKLLFGFVFAGDWNSDSLEEERVVSSHLTDCFKRVCVKHQAIIFAEHWLRTCFKSSFLVFR